MISNFRGLKVTVMGLGSFGGAIGAARFLARQGARVTITDLKPAEELADSLAQLSDCPPETLRLGGHDERDFREADLVVASPAVPEDSPYLRAAAAAGVPITSEINLFWERNRGRTVCITGSNGKSTTAALVHAVLAATLGAPTLGEGPARYFSTFRQELQQATGAPGRAAGGVPAGPVPRCWLGGNIGGSLLDEVDHIAPSDWVVLELSSFQLESLAPLEPNPDVAIVTNFSPNHLDRHKTVEAYRAAKQNLLRWQTADRIAILNQNDSDVSTWRTAARRYWFGHDDEGRQGVFSVGFDPHRRRALYRNGPREQVLPLGEWFSLPGAHNFQNALAATCAAAVLGAAPSGIARGLSAFPGLPHRLELVADASGRRFYNDSKATTPEATLLALGAFRGPVVLLAGGSDKGIDLSGLTRGIVERGVKAVSLMGQTAERLRNLIAESDSAGRISARCHATFDEAFDWAAAQSAPGDVVLLSPGCASYDWFRNYEARGAAFTQRARAWREA